MTHLFNNPDTFMEDALDGFCDAFSRYVVQVPGGVVRRAATPEGKVAVVVGGGSGHYPAFCGVVGDGFADGAVVGNIFTSPSTEDAYNVGRAAQNGGGVFFITGNYAGDVMNFNLAQDRLNAEGIETRNLYVTDDVASAPIAEIAKRRGIAGDFVVFKVAGAAADEGADLAEVERLAAKANDRTRTMGVGLDGCTMPGASDKLFHVPAGRMGVGLGIHGEPGIAESDLLPARDLGLLLLERVLAEEPADSTKRVGVILNGLGATKYEELFVVWKTVAAELAERGYTVVDPEVGELVTSLDMAGISLTLAYLDDELEKYWTAPADTPAYKKGAVDRHDAPERDLSSLVSSGDAVREGSEASRAAAGVAVAALAAMDAKMRAEEDELARIDAVAGDGDHGRGMVRGVGHALEAARTAADAGGGVRSVLGAAGEAWAGKAGGTSGVLWGRALQAFGEALGDDTEAFAPTDVVAGARAFLDSMLTLGKAHVGDKTMLDALVPFVDGLEKEVAAGRSLTEAWTDSAQVAVEAAAATAALAPKVGRARPLAERSIGTPDAGATSLAMCAVEVATVLASRKAQGGEQV
ncbi:dihydroxyacetone kinase family protein [Raineyella fluvialis]|uniref:DAK2 domain-containing protein n=1 Tax=Raineyella fluvialis TaxID=2662261 RepID=A0A5Q2F9T5_9ACTN|nr:dihydroxyacetone kinase family protein [Raineyella fluvialis]QGF23141.1 DAK2 domain-containing protein [Raineyella fluvialis]